MALTHARWSRWYRTIPLLLVAPVLLGYAGCLNYIYKRLQPEAMPAVDAPSPLTSLRAETCGACHQEIYQEWSSSMMAKAFTDPVFQVDWKHDNQFYYCLNCHAPLEQQQPELVSGLRSIKPLQGEGVPNPNFDPALQSEGVTCVVCHLKDGQMEGPIETELSPHPVRVNPNFADSSRCERCHQMPPMPFSKEPRSLIDTHEEWRAWQATTGDSRGCVDCHMPAVTRPLVVGMPERAGRKHTFSGSWDDTFVVTGARLEDPRWDGDTVAVSLRNETGHRFPTGGPERGVGLTAKVLGADGGVLWEQTQWLVRVEGGPGVRPSDNTLLPAESRRMSFTNPVVMNGAQIELILVFDRLKQHPEIVEALKWGPSKHIVEMSRLSVSRTP